MKIMVLYDKKKEKVISSDYVELDLNDLVNYWNFRQDELLKIPNSQVKNKTILEWFTVNNISYWWFVYPPIYRRYNEGILFIDQLSDLIEKYSPDLIILRGIFEKINIIKDLCLKNKIKLKVSILRNLVFLSIRTSKNVGRKILLTRIQKNKIKNRMNLFTNKKILTELPSQYTVICSADTFRRSVSNENGRISREEFILQPILEEFHENNIPILCFDIGYSEKNLKILYERLKTGFNWVPADIFFYKPKSNTTKKTINILNKSIKKLIKSGFGDIFVYRGINLTNYMNQIFTRIMEEQNLPSYIHLMNSVNEVFILNPPRALIQIYEYGPIEKAFLLAAKKNGIRTVAMQHGIIHNHHPDYMHLEIQSENNPLGNPIPDLTLVFGEFYKKVLTQSGHYPKNKVRIMGNPTFYNLSKIKNSFNRTEILKKYHLPDKKIILIPVDYNFARSDANPGRITLNILHNGLKNYDELIVLVRPHPGKPFEQTQLDHIYPENKFHCSKGSLLEDLFISDLVLTTGSTVAIDASIFKKPVIFINILDEPYAPDIQKFMIQHSIATSCTQNDLISKVISTLNKEYTKMDTSKKQREFLESFFDYGKTHDLTKLIYD